MRVAAGNLDIDNLSAAGGLDRLLNTLRSLFPDFSNIELLNDRGQTLAMMGDLNLSLTGAPKSAQVVIDSSTVENKFLFRDDPANQSFLIIMQHGDPDSGRWFSRTRFLRTPVDAILTAAGPEKSTRLSMHEIPKNVDEQSGPNMTDNRPAASPSRSADGTTARWWNPRKVAETQLLMPGWSLILETVPGWKDYCPQALIPGLLLLLIALYYFRQRDSNRRDDFQYSASHLAPSIEPEWEDLSELSSNMRIESTGLRETATNEFPYSPGNPERMGRTRRYSGTIDSTVEQGDPLGELLPEFFFESEQKTAVLPPMASDDPLNAKCLGETSLGQLPETLEVIWSEPRTNKTEIDSNEPEYVTDSKFLSA